MYLLSGLRDKHLLLFILVELIKASCFNDIFYFYKEEFPQIYLYVCLSVPFHKSTVLDRDKGYFGHVILEIMKKTLYTLYFKSLPSFPFPPFEQIELVCN